VQAGTAERVVEQEQTVVLVVAEVHRTHELAEGHTDLLVVAVVKARTVVAVRIVVSETRIAARGRTVGGTRTAELLVEHTSFDTAMTRAQPAPSAAYRIASPLATTCHASRITCVLSSQCHPNSGQASAAIRSLAHTYPPSGVQSAPQRLPAPRPG